MLPAMFTRLLPYVQGILTRGRLLLLPGLPASLSSAKQWRFGFRSRTQWRDSSGFSPDSPENF